MSRLTRVLLLSVIVLAGVAALVLPRLDEGPIVVCETGDDALVSCASDENGRMLADSLIVAGMLASVLLVLRSGRDDDEEHGDSGEVTEAAQAADISR